MAYDTILIFQTVFSVCVCPILDYAAEVWGFGDFEEGVTRRLMSKFRVSLVVISKYLYTVKKYCFV